MKMIELYSENVKILLETNFLSEHSVKTILVQPKEL